MDDAARLRHLVDVWERACGDLVTLARSLTPEDGDLPTDLEGWSVRDHVAHLAHLESVCAGGPEETVEVPEAPHLRGPMNHYTEQGVLARRGRDLGVLCDELEAAVALRLERLRSDPPTDPTAHTLTTPGGAPWDDGTLLSNRPLDVWMHEQDVRRATDRPGGWDSPAAAHVIGVFGRALPMVVGKRAGAEPGRSVVLDLDGVGVRLAVRVGDDGRAAFARDLEPTEATAAITMTPEAYVVASGGRRAPEGVTYAGDEDLGRRVVAGLAVTP